MCPWRVFCFSTTGIEIAAAAEEATATVRSSIGAFRSPDAMNTRSPATTLAGRTAASVVSVVDRPDAFFSENCHFF